MKHQAPMSIAEMAECCGEAAAAGALCVNCPALADAAGEPAGLTLPGNAGMDGRGDTPLAVGSPAAPVIAGLTVEEFLRQARAI